MHPVRPFPLLAAALVLSACVSPTIYAPSPGPGEPGYAEQRIDQNRFRVSFEGNSRTPRPTVENFLLYRAAELTLARGYAGFLLGAQDVQADTYYRSDFDAWPGAGFYWTTWPWGGGFGGSVSATSRPVTSYAAYADVIMLTAAQMQGNPQAIDARNVIANLGAQVNRPPR